MNARQTIDQVLEARPVGDRTATEVYNSLKKSSLQRLDQRIQDLVAKIDNWIERYQKDPGPDLSLAFSGDILEDPEPSYTGLQAAFHVARVYASMLEMYSYQAENPSQLISLPCEVVKVGDSVRLVPDVWEGQWDVFKQKIERDLDVDDSEPWDYSISPSFLKSVWEKIKPLIPNSSCIRMDQIRPVLKQDRAQMATNVVKAWKEIQRSTFTYPLPKNDWASTYKKGRLGPVVPGSEMDSLSAFIDDLYNFSYM